MTVLPRRQPLSSPVLRTGLLVALLAAPAHGTLDQDGDGISDLWAALHPSAVAPAEDPDGDSASNLAEATAGTDPASAASRLAAIAVRDSAGNLQLRWQGVGGKRYRIQSSVDLANWSTLADEFAGTGTDLAPTVATAGSITSTPQFWRVAVSDADADSDELNDWEESRLGTNPGRMDTDGDELSDSWEAAHGTDPLAATPPVITSQPQAMAVLAGQTATFTVTAVGDGPFDYQWLRNGQPIANERFTNFTTPATALADDGTLFAVVVTDAAGRSTTSSAALLSVTTGARRTQHYVDPVSGTDSGDGSASNPWKSLQTVVNTLVETRNWESLPYAEGKTLVPVHAGAAVRAGDTIWLRSGDHGGLVIQSAYNTAPITIAAEAGCTPRLNKVQVQSAQNWILRGLSVSPSYAATYSAATIVTVQNHGWRGPASDVELDALEVFSVPDESVWPTAADWNTNAADGINASAARVRVRNCRLRIVDFGISMSGVGAHVDHNTIDGFAGDGLRGLGDEGFFEANLVKNRRNVNSNHPDGFQSWSLGADGAVGAGVVKNITLRGNVFIAYESPSIPFTGVIQGIGCFDGFFEGWIVENNVVVTDHWHGITLLGARNCRIVNNTVVDLVPGNSPAPWIMVSEHKDGTASTDCVVRNNLTTRLNTSADTTNRIVVDHNLVLPADLSGCFVAPAAFDFRLLPTAPAVDQGSAELAPSIDADGAPRPAGAAVDVGAYEYAP